MSSGAPVTPGTDILPKVVAHARRGVASVRGVLGAVPEIGAIGAALSVFVFFAVTTPNFLTVASVSSMLIVAAEIGVIAIPMTLLMISGHFDLSAGSVLGFSSLLLPVLVVNHGVQADVALLAAFAAALAIGWLHGAITVHFGLPSFIVTLGGLLFWRAATFVMTGGFPLSLPKQPGIISAFSFPLGRGFYASALWFAAFACIFGFVLARTRFGNWVFAAGGNERAARSLGVPVDRVWIWLFVLTAAGASIAGFMQVGRFNSVDALRGAGIEQQVIAAAVIGGVRLTGGYGSVIGTALGCLMFGMIRNGLVLAGLGSYWFEGITGLILVGAVIVNQWLARGAGERR